MSFQIPFQLTYSGTTQSLEAWFGGGTAEPNLRYTSRAADVFTVRVPGSNPGAAAAIPFDGIITLQAKLNGSSSWTNIFVGRRVKYIGKASGGYKGTTYLFKGPWYDLESTIFQQIWRTVVSDIGGVITYGVQTYSAINLFQDISAGPANPWAYFGTGSQILQIISYATTSPATCNLQAGTIDANWLVPYYPVKTISCADALLMCLKPTPDAVTFFDYTTTPPTLHFRQRPNLTALTLPWGGTDVNGRVHYDTPTITSREDLIPSQVVIQYKQTNTVNGAPNTSFLVDGCSAAGQSNTLTGQPMHSVVCAIDLTGGNTTVLAGQVNAASFDPTSAAFWQKHKSDLSDTNRISNLVISAPASMVGGTPVTAFVTQSDGITPFSYGGLNELLTEKGTGVAPWMTLGNAGGTAVSSTEVIIRCLASYTVLNSQATASGGKAVPMHTVTNHPFEVRLKLTNSPVGLNFYWAIGSFTAPETPPPAFGGKTLSQYVFASMQTLQWEGDYTLTDPLLFQLITPGNVLNFVDGPRNTLGSGANAAWATMNAAIYDVEYDFARLHITVHFGPHKHLSPNELFDFLRYYQHRLVIQNPNTRNTAQGAGGSVNNLQTDTTKENSVEGTEVESAHTVIGAPLPGDPSANAQVMVQHDAAPGGTTVARQAMQYLSAAGSPVVDNNHGQWLIELGSTKDGSGVFHAVKLNQVQFTDGSGATKYFIGAVSADFTDASAAPAFTISGGGGLQIYAIAKGASTDSLGNTIYAGISQNYYSCYKVNAGLSVDTSHQYEVAKPFELRNNSVAVALGVTYNYSGYANDGSTRTATNASTSQASSEAVVPAFTGFGSSPGYVFIIVASVASTGVTPTGGSELTLIDVNAGARAFQIVT